MTVATETRTTTRKRTRPRAGPGSNGARAPAETRAVGGVAAATAHTPIRLSVAGLPAEVMIAPGPKPGSLAITARVRGVDVPVVVNRSDAARLAAALAMPAPPPETESESVAGLEPPPSRKEVP